MRPISFRIVLTCLLVVVCICAAPALHAQGQGSAPAAETATEFYKRFHALVPTATSLDQLLPFWNAELIRQVNMQPPADRAQTLGFVQRIEAMTSNVRVLRETATPTGVTLDLEGVDATGKAIIGTVTVVKEGGAWKLGGQEQWMK